MPRVSRPNPNPNPNPNRNRNRNRNRNPNPNPNPNPKVAQVAAREFLSPLVDKCCDRLAGILLGLMEITLASLNAEEAATTVGS